VLGQDLEEVRGKGEYRKGPQSMDAWGSVQLLKPQLSQHSHNAKSTPLTFHNTNSLAMEKVATACLWSHSGFF